MTGSGPLGMVVGGVEVGAGWVVDEVGAGWVVGACVVAGAAVVGVVVAGVVVGIGVVVAVVVGSTVVEGVDDSESLLPQDAMAMVMVTAVSEVTMSDRLVGMFTDSPVPYVERVVTMIGRGCCRFGRSRP